MNGKKATLRQGNQVLNLILQADVSSEQLQQLIERGLLADLLSANLSQVERSAFQGFLISQHLTAPASLREQFISFMGYNNWLEENYPDLVIWDGKIVIEKELELRLLEEKSERLLFYCHPDKDKLKPDYALTARLAWEYLASQRKVKKNEEVSFDNLLLNTNEQMGRPMGFYTKSRHLEDNRILGKHLQGKSAQDIYGHLVTDEWGLASEGFQFLAITHSRYIEAMDGAEVPFFILPGLVIPPNIASQPHKVLCLCYKERELILGALLYDHSYSRFAPVTMV